MSHHSHDQLRDERGQFRARRHGRLARFAYAIGLSLTFTAALQLNVTPAFAVKGVAPVSCVGSDCSMTGPANVTTLGQDLLAIGQGTSAMTTIANGAANTVLKPGLPPTWAAIVDAEVPDTITANNYVLLAGDTMTGLLVLDNLGIEGTESDTQLACAAGDYWITADLSDTRWDKCENGVRTALDTTGTAINPVTMFRSETVLAAGVATYFYGMTGVGSTTEADVELPMPASTYANMRCRASAIPGAGNDVVVTMRTGACGTLAASTLTCTINTAVNCEDLTNSASPTAGQCADFSVLMPAALGAGDIFVGCSAEQTA